MSEGSTAAGAARRVGSGTGRLVQAWRVLPHESRLAASASVSLFLTLFLPWYQVTLIAPAQSARLQSASAAITGWGAFSFVEAAILLVAAGVLTLLFQRAEGRAFHLPGGDGGVITAAGIWACALIVWRIFDKQGATTNGPSATSSGVEWGIFVALAAAAFLAYSGSRIRAAHRPEPPLPGEDRAPVGSNAAADTTEIPRRRERPAQSRRAARIAEPVPEDRATAVRATAPTPDRAPAPPQDPPSDATPVRPRRRVSASELFELVVPEDPPAMRFGRIPPSSRPSIHPAPAQPAEEQQLTIPFRDHDTQVLGEDETRVLVGEDETRVLAGEDETRVLAGEDETRVLAGEDETRVLGGEQTLRFREDETVRLGEDETLPLHPRPKR